jgi:hypothetical protein
MAFAAAEAAALVRQQTALCLARVVMAATDMFGLLSGIRGRGNEQRHRIGNEVALAREWLCACGRVHD